jgi:hypothetical protein
VGDVPKYRAKRATQGGVAGRVDRRQMHGISSHRKEWILDRMRELAGLFAVEVCGYLVELS